MNNGSFFLPANDRNPNYGIMARIALGIEYDGSKFCGWQWQPNLRSIQSELERALAMVAGHPVSVVCAGRTDAGVHALEQIVHFESDAHRQLQSWLLGGNSHLPDDIRILWVKQVKPDFHARYSAIARLYRYIILNRPVKSALASTQQTWCYYPLNEENMHTAAQHLIGNHDFSSFRAQGCQSKSPFRIIYFIDVIRVEERIIISISANAFLHHMVRNIVGVLLAVGQGKRPTQWVLEVLLAKNRRLGGVTAPPYGLYLEAVYYPDDHGMPKHLAFNKLPDNAKRFS